MHNKKYMFSAKNYIPNQKKYLKYINYFSIILEFLLVLTFTAIYIFVDKQKYISNTNVEIFINNSGNYNNNQPKEVLQHKIEISENEINKKNKKNDKNSEKIKLNVEMYDFSEWNKNCPKELMVINRKNPIDKNLKFEIGLCYGKKVAVELCENLKKMIDDARSQNINILIISGYRSIKHQEMLFNNQIKTECSNGAVNEEQAEKNAQKIVAKPNCSEHNFGYAVDLNCLDEKVFCSSKEYKWLIKNSYKYGFILRYKDEWQPNTGVKFEPWHFRYTGIKNAEKINNSGLCLENYIIKNYMIS